MREQRGGFLGFRLDEVRKIIHDCGMAEAFAEPMRPGEEEYHPVTAWTPEKGAAIGEALAARIEAHLRARRKARWAHGRDPDWAERAAAEAVAAPW